MPIRLLLIFAFALGCETNLQVKTSEAFNGAKGLLDQPSTVDAGPDVVTNQATRMSPVVEAEAVSFRWEKVSGPGTLTFDNENTKAPTLSADADGVYVVRLSVSGSAGDSVSDELNFTWDLTPPTFQTPLADVSSKDPANVSADVRDALTAMTFAWSKVSGAGNVTFSHPSAATTVTVDQDGPYVIRLSVTDQAGNTASDEFTYTRDTVPPSFVSLLAINAASDGYITPSETSSTLPLFALDASDYVIARYTTILDESTPRTCDASQTYDQSSIPNINQLSADGVFVICVELADDAGNMSYGKSQAVERDTTPPAFTSLNGANAASDAYINASETGSTAAAFALSASGYTTDDYTAFLDDTPAITCDSGKTYSNADIPTIDTMPAADETYAVCVRLTDAAGNVTYGKSQPIVRDTTPPTFTSLVGANEAADGYVNATETGSTSPALVLMASGHSVAEYTVFLDDTSVVPCDSNQTYSTTSVPLIDAIPSSDKPYAVCVRLRDTADNTSYAKSQQITRDTVAPSAVLSNVPHDNAETGLIDITVGGSDVTHYRYKFNSSCSSATGYSANIAIATHITDSTLPEGANTLCVVGVDQAGNIQSYASATQTSFQKSSKTPAIIQVAVGQLSTCVLTATYRVRCFGAGSGGRLGTGNSSNIGDAAAQMGDNLPYLPLTKKVKQISLSASGVHACVLTVDGGVRCWGHGSFGQLGTGNSSSIGDTAGSIENLTDIDLGGKARKIVTGETFNCALLEDFSVKCWGRNNYGQLGLGDTQNRGDNPNEMGTNLPTVNVGSNKTVLDLAAGNEFVCVILNDRSLKCWGRDFFGFAFNSTANNARGDAPNEMGDNMPNINLGAGVMPRSVSAAGSHICIVSMDYQVKCWGNSAGAQLGYEGAPSVTYNNVASTGFLPLGAGRSALEVSAGSARTCVLLDNHQVKCWGSNYFGQLGLGDTNDRTDDMGETVASLPTVSLGTGRYARALATNNAHSCVLLDTGGVKCWGRNEYGQLGQGDTSNRGDNANEMGDNLPFIDFGSGPAVMPIKISSGYAHTCVLLSNSTVKCWGQGANGQLGYGSNTTVGNVTGQMGANLPVVDVGTNRKVMDLELGGSSSCVILEDSSAKCWGHNMNAQLGLGHLVHTGDNPGEMGDALPALSLGTGRKVMKIMPNLYHSCALLDNGSLKCWGDGFWGATGAGNADILGETASDMGDNLIALDFGGGAKVFDFSVGRTENCVILDSQDLKCWGRNNGGQLGLGDTTMRGYGPNEMGTNLPVVSLGAGLTAVTISGAASSFCAVVSNGSLKCWGANGTNGLLGIGSTVQAIGDEPGEMGDNLVTTNIGTASHASAVGRHESSSCALSLTGLLKCWGYAATGKGLLGIGTSNVIIGDEATDMGDNLASVNLGSHVYAVQVAAANSSTCALTSTGLVKCWGNPNNTGLEIATETGHTPETLGNDLPFVKLY